jgi:hypothetical protein
MNPAKNRDRKCSTCRHYQPSPLWRKGWCRNPLLYDRNTNHLVEADSLACNRTFIDYWEPVTGPQPAVGPAARSPKPRIAPSIPIDTMDANGQRGVVTGNTPAPGSAHAVSPQAVAAEEVLLTNNREVPRLSLIRNENPPAASNENPAKVTRQMETIEAPADPEVARTAAQRISAARAARRASFLYSSTGRLVLLVLALVVLAGAGGVFLLKGKTPAPVVLAKPTATVTVPAPTPTGFGDATATPLPTNTVAAPPPGQIGVNGWVQVNSANGLVVRETAAKAGRRLGVLPNGTKAHVVGGPTSADGLTWWKIDSYDPNNKGATGWCAGSFLQPTSAP